jgi:hypothetical protein
MLTQNHNIYQQKSDKLYFSKSKKNKYNNLQSRKKKDKSILGMVNSFLYNLNIFRKKYSKGTSV